MFMINLFRCASLVKLHGLVSLDPGQQSVNSARGMFVQNVTQR